MSTDAPGMDPNDKAIWNSTTTLLQGLAWANDRVREGDYTGSAKSPVDEPSANINSSIHLLLQSPLLMEKAKKEKEYAALRQAVLDTEIDLRTQTVTSDLLGNIIARIRTTGVFEGEPQDQEVPDYRKYDAEEL